jgi:uncharacterized membrane protein
MLARLSMIWNRLTTGLWALPMLIVAAAALLAVLAVTVLINPGAASVWWLYSGDAKAASGFLANLLTAMITMATLAISITMVVLTLAAQSLGPRLIDIFMGDTRTKLALGLFIGTVVYLLIVLRSVVGDTDSVPNLAVTIGAGLVIASVLVLLFFVHHLARSIVADTIIHRVGETLDGWITDRFPQQHAEPTDAAEDLASLAAGGKPILAQATGYIQAVDHEAIVKAACEAVVTVELHLRPGHFVLQDDIIGRVAPEASLDADLAHSLVSAVVIGPTRTPLQDIEYPIRQLVEIALRALSPGVNDPFTAMAAVDRLAGAVAVIMSRGEPQSIWRDDNDVIRLVIPTTSLDGILDAAFNQIRQAGASQPAILIRLVDRLGQLLAHADCNQATAILRHIDITRATGQRGIADEADRLEFLGRVETAVGNAKEPGSCERKG